MRTVAFSLVAMLTLVDACSKPKEATPRSPPSASTASALVSASASASAPSAVPPVTPTDSVSPSASYLVSLTGDDCPVTLRINEVPLLELKAGDKKSVGESIDLWIRGGTNSVTLEARGKLAKGCASVNVVAVAEDGDQRTAPRVLDTRWPAAGLRSGVQAFEFHGPVAHRCQLWRDVEAMALTAADKVQLLERVRELHGLFARRDTKNLAERTDYRAQDIARCLGKPPAWGVESQTSFYSQIMSGSDFVVVPLDESALAMDVVGGGRLVWLHRRDGKLLLENSLGQGMDFYAAKIAGQWTIVR
jgi:hypothetical protein